MMFVLHSNVTGQNRQKWRAGCLAHDSAAFWKQGSCFVSPPSSSPLLLIGKSYQSRASWVSGCLLCSEKFWICLFWIKCCSLRLGHKKRFGSERAYYLEWLILLWNCNSFERYVGPCPSLSLKFLLFLFSLGTAIFSFLYAKNEV